MAFTPRTVKDQVVQFPNRFKIDGVSHIIEPDFGIVTEPGTEINKAYLQPIEDALGAAVTKEELDARLSDTAAQVKPARIVIGTSASGWTAKDCHYLCDGTDDQTEINNAIQALPILGGEIIILDGTYNITAKINVTKDNVSIRGNGNATILKRMFNDEQTTGVIRLQEVEGCRIENLQVDGNSDNYKGLYNCNINLTSSNNNIISGNVCNNTSWFGIDLNSSNNNIISGSVCNNNGLSYPSYIGFGIGLNLSCSNNVIVNNSCNDNGGHGIYMDLSSDNTVMGNICNNNGGIGLVLEEANNNSVVGNICNNNNSGILLKKSSNNTVTGNTCIRGTGIPEDYTTHQYTIHLIETDNNYNLVSSNNCMGKAVTVDGGTGNSTWGNKYDAGNDLPI